MEHLRSHVEEPKRNAKASPDVRAASFFDTVAQDVEKLGTDIELQAYVDEHMTDPQMHEITQRVDEIIASSNTNRESAMQLRYSLIALMLSGVQLSQNAAGQVLLTTERRMDTFFMNSEAKRIQLQDPSPKQISLSSLSSCHVRVEKNPQTGARKLTFAQKEQNVEYSMPVLANAQDVVAMTQAELGGEVVGNAMTNGRLQLESMGRQSGESGMLKLTLLRYGTEDFVTVRLRPDMGSGLPRKLIAEVTALPGTTVYKEFEEARLLSGLPGNAEATVQLSFVSFMSLMGTLDRRMQQN